MKKKVNGFYNQIIFICLSLIMLSAYMSWDLIEGDPSIYLSFAKTFFDKPFSFGSVDNVSFGATSPFFLIIISCVYSLFGIENFLLVMKVLNTVFYLMAAFFITKIVLELMNPKISKSFLGVNASNKFTFVFSVTLLMMGFFPHLIDASQRLYETSLILFFTSMMSYIFLKERFSLAILISSISYLIRPELLSLQISLIFSIFIVSYFRHKVSFRMIIISVLSLSLIFIYHLYIYLHSAELMPSSVISRSIRTDEYTFLVSNYLQLKANPQLYIIPILTAFYFWKGKTLFAFGDNQEFSKNLFQLAIGGALLMASFILLVAKSISTRYIDFLFAFIIIALSCCFIKLTLKHYQKQTKIILSSIILVIFSFLYKTFLPEYPSESTLEARLAPDLAQKINAIPDNKKLAMYEIQTQFYINRPVISLDSRVGSHFLDFTKGTSDLLSSMLENGVTYIGVDHNVSPRIAKDDLFRFMLQMEKNQNPKGMFLHKFTGKHYSVEQVLKKDTPGFSMWRTIYKIEEI